MNVQDFLCILLIVSDLAPMYIMIQIWLHHCKYEPHSHYAMWAYRPNIFAHISQNTTTALATPHNDPKKCVRNKYMLQMLYICQLPLVKA